jgi:hypothetical protein
LRYANAAELAAALAPFGSEDARVSLTRVTGMSTQHTLPHHVTHDSGSVATTLTVASAPDSSARAKADRRDTSDIGPVVARRGRSWIVLSGAVAAVLVVVAMSRQWPALPPAELARAVPAAPPGVTTVAPAVPPVPAPSARELLPATSGRPSTTASPPVRAPRQRRDSLQGSSKPLPSVVAPAASASEPAPLGASRDVQSEPTLGRSAEIERLIEQRH